MNSRKRWLPVLHEIQRFHDGFCIGPVLLIRVMIVVVEALIRERIRRKSGNGIREKRLLELFRDSPYRDDLWDRSDRDGHCRICRYKHYCGGCRARADAYFGSIKANDPGCVFNQESWDELTTSESEGDEAVVREYQALA